MSHSAQDGQEGNQSSNAMHGRNRQRTACERCKLHGTSSLQEIMCDVFVFATNIATADPVGNFEGKLVQLLTTAR